MAILDPVLNWTLALNPFLAIFILSVIVTLISNLIYKFTTDQKEMKRLKLQIEDFRKKIKESKDNPKKMMKLNNEAMQVNMKYMTRSLKPMLFTFIPIILVIGWMAANFTYAPITADDALTITASVRDGFAGELVLTSETIPASPVTAAIVPGEEGAIASFALQVPQGEHAFTVTYDGNAYGGNNGTIVVGRAPSEQRFEGTGPIEAITIDYPKIKPLGSFSLFGWEPGWLSVYIVLSIILSLSSRKLMKIY
jgi:uncharacterized membrane protein (DUF106 family)